MQLTLQWLSQKLVNAVCNFLSNLTPNPLRQVLQVGGADGSCFKPGNPSNALPPQRTGSPTSVGEQESKPLSLRGKGLERGCKDKLHIALVINLTLFTLAFSFTLVPATFAKLPETNSGGGVQISATQSPTSQQLVEQGESFYQAGRFAEAVTVLQQAIRIYQTQGDRFPKAAALTNLSLAYQQLGLWKEATGAINSSLELLGWDEKNQKLALKSQKSEQLEFLAQTLDIQGGLQLSLGQAEASLTTLLQAEQIWHQLGNNAEVTRSHINQAQALRVSGFYRRALETLERVNQQLQTQADSPMKVAGLRSLGNVLQLSGDFNRSWQILQQSLEVSKRLQLPEEISLTEFSLGNTAKALGNRQDAIAHYQKATEIARNPLTKVQAQINQLSLLVETEQTANVKALIPTIQAQLLAVPVSQASIYARINFACTIAKISDKKDIAQMLAMSIQQAKTISDRRAESYALGSLAGLYEQTGQWQEAEDLTQQALLISDSDIAYRWQWQLGRLLKAQGRIESAIAAYDAAVATLQSLRNDLVAISREVQFNFRDRIEPIYRQSVELLLQEKGQGKPDLDKARKRIEALQLAELDNFFKEACLNNQSVILDQVVDRENPNTAIFYPIILENQLAVILKLPNRPLIYKSSVVNRQEVEQVVTLMREAIVQPDANKKFHKLSQQLYGWLIKPVKTEIDSSKVDTLVFVPDGLLRNIPMASLDDGKDYLIQKYAVALSPGLQLFTPQHLTRSKLNALAAGLSLPPKNEKISPLPKVKEELNLIQKLGVKTITLLDQEFKSTTLEKTINVQPFRIVHLATHGQFSSKAQDTFILAADGRINVSQLDGLLKSRDKKRSEPIELLVLSACQTATGDNRAALGLAGVAIRAGARSTLASLWQIGDDSTTFFIGEFYQQLIAGKTKAQALQFAQLKMLADSEYARPLYWASYVLVGNWL
ncbi:MULTISPECIES: CHAT domain-containing protein [unclassified Nostoc]|uniref:CHAT domain-containing protein n=1 Tax=unclassified Nostoc TaxID=2593658 RepID=UPI002610E83C|nr:CHAT domain-containing protein [Nostoc sp. S13]MDF5740019.1 CHAT domain-containing protein [Nostoc sp. S13]